MNRSEWYSSQDGEKLLRFAAEYDFDRKSVIRAACACARLVLHLIPPGEERPRLAIETAERWCDGKATIEEVEVASATAFSIARRSNDHYIYASDASASAAYASAAASEAPYTYTAAYAATAADATTYDHAAREVMKAKCAVEVRKYIDWDELERHKIIWEVMTV